MEEGEENMKHGDIEVTTGNIYSVGSCNACKCRDDYGYPDNHLEVTCILLKDTSFRLCNKCRVELIKALRDVK